MNPVSFFAGRKLLIATMHQKEQVMAPVLEKALGASCTTSAELDTDQFGTFCGGIERTSSPVEAALTKCRYALLQAGYDLGVASEGSFGPHPSYIFLPADEEVVVLLDLLNGIEVTAAVSSLHTNFGATEVTDTDSLLEFAQRAGFPEHGLLLRSGRQPDDCVIKGIRTVSDLLSGFNQLQSYGNQVLVETDMRAMHNPTRMKVIEQATHKLCEKLLSACPVCAFPGYSVNGVTPGLPCAQCGAPSRSPLYIHYTCRHCGHKEDLRTPPSFEDPQFCDYCNP